MQSFCELTLRSDWQAIIAPSDPFAAPPNGYSSVTWLASLARAQIEGDLTLCSDVTAREWLTAGSGVGGPPPAGANPAPVHPVASCMADFRNVVGIGLFTVSDPGNVDTLKLFVGPSAASHAAGGSAPPFDPAVVCSTAPGKGRDALTRDVCNELFNAVATALGSRQSGVHELVADPRPIACLKSLASCPPPTGGQWLGSMVAATGSKTGLGFDVADVGGTVSVTEVPYSP